MERSRSSLLRACRTSGARGAGLGGGLWNQGRGAVRFLGHRAPRRGDLGAWQRAGLPLQAGAFREA